MSEKAYTLDAKQYEKFRKLMEKEEKQKRYQQILNAKLTLQAKWARMNGCPVETKHAEFYLDVTEQVRETLTMDNIIAMGNSWDKTTDATAHAVDALGKKEGAEEPSLADETEEEELSA